MTLQRDVNFRGPLIFGAINGRLNRARSDRLTRMSKRDSSARPTMRVAQRNFPEVALPRGGFREIIKQRLAAVNERVPTPL